VVNKTEECMELVVPKIPETLEAFIDLRDQLAHSPEGGAVMMVLAFLLAAEDPQGRLGRDALTLAVDRSRLVPSSEGYKGWDLSIRDARRIEEQFTSQPWAPLSYFLRTAPERGYVLPDPPYRLSICRNPYSGTASEGRVKVFVMCSGAASPRPVTLARNDRGLWKAVEWSSLTMGVVPPVESLADEL
jgi:hypothetical protein